MYTAQVCGRLGADPEFRMATSGTPVCNIRVAVDQFSQGQRTKPLWVRATAFGDLANVINKHARKGDKIMLQGNVRQRTWKDNDGREHQVQELAVNGADLTVFRKTDAENSAEDQAGTEQEQVEEPSIPEDMP